MVPLSWEPPGRWHATIYCRDPPLACVFHALGSPTLMSSRHRNLEPLGRWHATIYNYLWTESNFQIHTKILVFNCLFLSFQGKIMSNKVSPNSNSLTPNEDDVTPMVAFLCGKPAMYLTSNGWEKDENTDCIKDPIKILDYCKQVGFCA